MIEFVQAVAANPFLQYAVLAGLLASVAAGVVGSYVVVRRITNIAGSIAHCVLGGLGAARYLQVAHNQSWCDPLYGAIAAALLAAVVIGLVSIRARHREDTAISALWAIGMAVGIVFIHKTPGYSNDLRAYLFGNLLFVSGTDLKLILAIDILVVGVSLLFYKPLLAVCFDQEFARLRGVPVELFYILLLCLTAMTIVVLVKVVGIVLVIALLTLPVAVAGTMTTSLRRMMLVAVLWSIVLTQGGLALSYNWDLPPGATIVLLAGALYLVSTIWRPANA